jgi:hypothetical protein
MKLVPILFLMLFFSIGNHAQTSNKFSILADGINYSGSTFYINLSGSEVSKINFDIYNNFGSAQRIIVSRKLVNVPNSWSDFYRLDNSTNKPSIRNSPNAAEINSSSRESNILELSNGEFGKLKCEINPDDAVSSTALYRYYVSLEGTNVLDSVDVQVEFVGTPKPAKEEIHVSIVPNPATDFIQITMNGIETASLKMVDVFGNIILKENIGSSKKLNVSEFNSGIYFFVFDVPGRKSFTRKVIIRG